MIHENRFGQPVGAPLSGRFPRPGPQRSTMGGRYATLMPSAPVHAEGLFAAFGRAEDGRDWTYLPIDRFETVAECRHWLEAAQQSDDPLYFTVFDSDARPVGWAAYLRIDPQNATIEVGWINFSPLLKGSRAATEAMYLMMAHVFDGLNYRRYEWKCDALNAPSRRAAERLGFQYEGTFRQATHYKGRNRDTAWYAVIDSDWPALKARFLRWLDPDNFDQAGHQRKRLQEV